jgi:hypothetical protein
MHDDDTDKRKPTGKAHTELRRQSEHQPESDKARTPLKPRTPVDRLPVDGDDDDLFNDMPV